MTLTSNKRNSDIRETQVGHVLRKTNVDCCFLLRFSPSFAGSGHQASLHVRVSELMCWITHNPLKMREIQP